jgi:hypothetical protein
VREARGAAVLLDVEPQQRVAIVEQAVAVRVAAIVAFGMP